MGTIRTKAYFTALPATNEYDRFAANNIPSQASFEDLFASVLMKAETATDSATTAQLGYVLIAADADALSRTDASSLPNTVIEPHHLPLLVIDGTELDYGASAVDYNGLNYEVVEGDVTGRASFKIEFNPDGLTAATPADDDYVVLVDTDDSNLPKKALVSDLVAAAAVWERDGSVASLVNATDNIDVEDSEIHFGDGELDNGGDRDFGIEAKSDGAGKSLTVHAGDGTTAGGHLNLLGSDASLLGGTGGDVNLYPGDGTTVGNVLLNYYGTTKRGLSAIGGPAVTGNQLMVYGKVNIDTGGLEVNGAGTSALDSFVGLNAGNEVQERTLAEFHVDLFGATSQGDILYDDGTNFTRLTLGTEGYLLAAGATGPEWIDGSITDEKVAAYDGGTPGFLDEVLVEADYPGIALAKDADILEVSLDISSLEEKLSVTGDTYIAIVDEASPTSQTKKILLSELSDWVISRIP